MCVPFSEEIPPEDWDQHMQVDAFRFEVINLIDRYHADWDMPVEAVIGVLEDVKLEYWISKRIEFDMDIRPD